VNIPTIPGRAIHPRAIHDRVADGLQRTLETVVLGDWRTLSEDQLKQAVARLRTIKASYLNHPMPSDHLEQSHHALASLDDALVSLYLTLDTIEGRDVAKQRDIYRALLDVQYPLLRARAALPLPVDAVQDGEDEIRQTETSVAPAVAHSAPVVQQGGAEEAHGEHEDNKEVHKQFRWSQGRLLQLQEAMRESRQSNTQAMIKEIATHFGWPVNAVSYKVYALRLQQHGMQEHAHGQEQVSSETKEDDRRGRSQEDA
jgi:hypothetical protein